VPRSRDLSAERARRWWQTRRPVASLHRAAAFIDDVGFALLFPSRGIDLPSLFQAASEQPIEGIAEVEWGPDAERVWGWKDELPRQGLAWYGRFVRGRPSFLSPALLADLYPRNGDPEDFTEADLGPEARRIAEILLLSGPTSSATLREALGVEGRRGKARFSEALAELGKKLVVTNFGTEDQGAGWPAAVLELTARAFPLRRRRRGREEARSRAARRFIDTIVVARPQDLARAFGWSSPEATRALETLVAAGEAVRDGQGFLPNPHP
jgi:winged helix DNA-binding protein